MNNSTQGILFFDACPACGSSEIVPFHSYTRFPAIIFPIEEYKRHDVDSLPLESFCCTSCGHIFLNRINTDFNCKLYHEYYYLYPFNELESMQQPYRQPFDRVASIYLQKGAATLLEIGCDNVSHMQSWLDLGFCCTAINPGAVNDKRVRFIDGFYGDIELKEQFDYVISRFNLEHILDFRKFFNALKRNLSPSGTAIIQVPNAEQFLASGVLSIFAHEHPHYFCQKSLLALIRRYGFEVLHISKRNEPSLICVFSYPGEQYEPRIYLHEITKNLGELEQILKSSPETVLYGAGLSVAGLIYSGNIDESALAKIKLIDDNPLLWGRFMPNTNIRVVSPEEVNFNEVSTIILMLSEQYHKNVLAKSYLQGFNGRILALTRNGLINVKHGRPC